MGAWPEPNIAEKQPPPNVMHRALEMMGVQPWALKCSLSPKAAEQ